MRIVAELNIEVPHDMGVAIQETFRLVEQLPRRAIPSVIQTGQTLSYYSNESCFLLSTSLYFLVPLKVFIFFLTHSRSTVSLSSAR